MNVDGSNYETISIQTLLHKGANVKASDDTETDHQVILETANRRALKKKVCQFLRSQGHIVYLQSRTKIT